MNTRLQIVDFLVIWLPLGLAIFFAYALVLTRHGPKALAVAVPFFLLYLFVAAMSLIIAPILYVAVCWVAAIVFGAAFAITQVADRPSAPVHEDPTHQAQAFGEGPKCKAHLPINSRSCGHCSATFGEGAAWKVKRL